VLLGPIIGRLFTCSYEEKILKQKTKGACSSPISMSKFLKNVYITCPGPNIIRLNTALIMNINNCSVFIHDRPFKPILMFLSKV
jgi:hypothetical protein